MSIKFKHSFLAIFFVGLVAINLTAIAIPYATIGNATLDSATSSTNLSPIWNDYSGIKISANGHKVTSNYTTANIRAIGIASGVTPGAFEVGNNTILGSVTSDDSANSAAGKMPINFIAANKTLTFSGYGFTVGTFTTAIPNSMYDKLGSINFNGQDGSILNVDSQNMDAPSIYDSSGNGKGTVQIKQGMESSHNGGFAYPIGYGINSITGNANLSDSKPINSVEILKDNISLSYVNITGNLLVKKNTISILNDITAANIVLSDTNSSFKLLGSTVTANTSLLVATTIWFQRYSGGPVAYTGNITNDTGVDHSSNIWVESGTTVSMNGSIGSVGKSFDNLFIKDLGVINLTHANSEFRLSNINNAGSAASLGIKANNIDIYSNLFFGGPQGTTIFADDYTLNMSLAGSHIGGIITSATHGDGTLVANADNIHFVGNIGTIDGTAPQNSIKKILVGGNTLAPFTFYIDDDAASITGTEIVPNVDAGSTIAINSGLNSNVTNVAGGFQYVNLGTNAKKLASVNFTPDTSSGGPTKVIVGDIYANITMFNLGNGASTVSTGDIISPNKVDFMSFGSFSTGSITAGSIGIIGANSHITTETIIATNLNIRAPTYLAAGQIGTVGSPLTSFSINTTLTTDLVTLTTGNIYAANTTHTNAILDLTNNAVTTIHGNYTINNGSSTITIDNKSLVVTGNTTLAGTITINAEYTLGVINLNLAHIPDISTLTVINLDIIPITLADATPAEFIHTGITNPADVAAFNAKLHVTSGGGVSQWVASPTHAGLLYYGSIPAGIAFTGNTTYTIAVDNYIINAPVTTVTSGQGTIAINANNVQIEADIGPINKISFSTDRTLTVTQDNITINTDIDAAIPSAGTFAIDAAGTTLNGSIKYSVKKLLFNDNDTLTITKDNAILGSDYISALTDGTGTLKIGANNVSLYSNVTNLGQILVGTGRSIHLYSSPPINTTINAETNSSGTVNIYGALNSPNLNIGNPLGNKLDIVAFRSNLGENVTVGNIFSNVINISGNSNITARNLLGGTVNISSPSSINAQFGSAGSPLTLLNINTAPTDTVTLTTQDIYATNFTHTNANLVYSNNTNIHGNYTVNNATVNLGCKTLTVSGHTILNGNIVINATYDGDTNHIAADFTNGGLSILDISGLTSITLNIQNNVPVSGGTNVQFLATGITDPSIITAFNNKFTVTSTGNSGAWAKSTTIPGRLFTPYTSTTNLASIIVVEEQLVTLMPEIIQEMKQQEKTDAGLAPLILEFQEIALASGTNIAQEAADKMTNRSTASAVTQAINEGVGDVVEVLAPRIDDFSGEAVDVSTAGEIDNIEVLEEGKNGVIDINTVEETSTNKSGKIKGASIDSGIAAGDAAERYGLWASAIGGMNSQRQRQGKSGFRSNFIGVMLGVDTMINENATIGLAIGNASREIKYRNLKLGDKSSVNSWIFAGYGNYSFDSKWFIRGVIVASDNKVNNKEERITAHLKHTAYSKYNLLSYGAEINGGYAYKTAKNIALTPYLGFRISHVNPIKYKETGSATLQNQQVTLKATNSPAIVGGIQISSSIDYNKIHIKPSIHAKFSYDINNKSPKGSYRPLIGTTLNYYTAETPHRSIYVIGGAIKAKSNNLEYGIGYDASFSDKYVGHSGSVTLKVKF